MRAAAALFLAALSACAGIVGFEDLDLVPDRSDAGDAGSTTGEAGGPGDGGGGTDAAPDAPKGCFDGLEHDYCYDFENVVNVDDGWTGKEIVGDSSVLDLASPPPGGSPHGIRALHSKIERGTGAMEVHIARVSRQNVNMKKPDGTTRRIKSSFDLYVESGDVNSYQAYAYTLLLGNSVGPQGVGEDTFFLQLTRDADAASVLLVSALEIYQNDAGVQYAGKPTNLTMRTQEWTHVEVVLNERLPGEGGGMVITVGGASDTYSLTSTSRAEKLRADFGWDVGTYAGGNWNGFIDNVAIDYTK